ncbi:MAG TPA: phage tail tube protein [Bryobacteraceae bacterium]|nr:phage tail tube protein [Blastocatellia bacterium]HXJ40525.1 phage tail tube protein [Bryobacteraceae bacterium]
MPFTAPTTYFSKANSGYLAQFLIGDAASPPNFTAISEIKSFAPDLVTMAEVDTTHLLSPNNTEEFVPAMIKPGKVVFGGNFLGDASQLNITTLAQGQTIFPFQIKAPVQRGTKTYVCSGTGFISSYKPGPFENNKAIEFSVEIQLTGAYTESTT